MEKLSEIVGATTSPVPECHIHTVFKIWDKQKEMCESRAKGFKFQALRVNSKHKITKWFGLEGTFKSHSVPASFLFPGVIGITYMRQYLPELDSEPNRGFHCLPCWLLLLLLSQGSAGAALLAPCCSTQPHSQSLSPVALG